MQSLCFISNIPVHYIYSKSPSRILFWFCSPSKKCPLISCCLVLCPEGGQTEKSVIRESNREVNLPFESVSTSVTPSRPGWSWPSNPFVWIFLGERKIGPNQLFIIWYILSWLIWVSVKILLPLFCFLPNSNTRSCFKGSLMQPTLAYIMLQPLTFEGKKIIP